MPMTSICFSLNSRSSASLSWSTEPRRFRKEGRKKATSSSQKQTNQNTPDLKQSKYECTIEEQHVFSPSPFQDLKESPAKRKTIYLVK